jgi:small subunit ribosomal protein S16
MLTIRMRRVGAKKKPRFRLVVTEARSAPDGAAMEVIGHYNPTSEPETIELDRQRLQHWLDRGAQLTDTVRTLVARHPEAVADAAVEPTAAVEPAAAVEAPPAGESEASDGPAAEVEAS